MQKINLKEKQRLKNTLFGRLPQLAARLINSSLSASVGLLIALLFSLQELGVARKVPPAVLPVEGEMAVTVGAGVSVGAGTAVSVTTAVDA